MRIKSNLKQLLDERHKSIRQFAKETKLPFETLRRLYNDDTERYQRDTLAKVCETLGVGIEQLLILVDDNTTEE